MLQQRPPPTSFLSIHKAFTSYPYPWGDHISEKKLTPNSYYVQNAMDMKSQGPWEVKRTQGLYWGWRLGGFPKYVTF